MSSKKAEVVEEKIMPVGGQAVIEGVMMRSPERLATAVRRVNGEVVLKIQEYQSLIQKNKWLNIPIMRGAITLVEVMILGIKHLNFSADIAMKDAILSGEARAKKMAGRYKLVTLTIMKIQAKYVYVTDKLKSVYVFKAVYSENYQ